MNPRVPRAQLAFILGMMLAAGVLLVLVVYVLHRVFRRRRGTGGLEPRYPRANNPTVFVSSAVQGVIASLKAQQKDLAELSRAAEDRATETSRITEIISREMPTGLLVFNREGFLTHSNPAAHTLLGIDNWSRRRYPEILGPDSALAKFVREGLEAGKTQAWETVEACTFQGERRLLKIYLAPYYGRTGEQRGIVCLFGEITGPATRRS